ncbi:MAG: PAS domain S-box protein [Acidobacteria bacterium]|nr:PAS domain S-box protein [Acidobacteriota bacterium]
MGNELEQLRRKTDALEKKCGDLEKSLRESEERFNKLFHASSNLISITTVKDGRMVDINEASAEFGGFRREELIGASSSALNLWADRKERERVIQTLLKEGRVQNLNVNLRSKTGDIRRVLFSADPITIHEEPCLLSVCIDITDKENEADNLKRSEEKYRMLVENSLQGLTIIQNGRIVFCNNAFADICGYTTEELMALPEAKPIIHPADRETVVGRGHERLSGKSVPRHYEYRILRKDGSFRWLEAYASVIDYKGAPAAQIVQLDITERKQAEISLRESEERFRLIAETVDEIFWIYDAEKEVATYLSPAFDRIWGYPREKIIDNPDRFLDRIHPDDLKNLEDANKLIKNGQPFAYRYRVIQPDGSVRHIWNRGYPIADTSGRTKRYVGVGQDVTEWKEAEEALIESKEYYNRIINCIGDPLFVKNHEHRFVLVNDALCAFSGMRREELLGNYLFDTMPESLAAYLRKHEEEVLNTGNENISEDILRDSGGSDCVVMTKKSLLTDKDGQKQIVGVIRDITEHKNLETQLLQAQKMEAIGILAGGVAHDFNNLLNVINGYSELLLEDMENNNPFREDVEQIHQAGQRAANLTSQLLAFSRKQILQAENLDLNTVISQMSTMLRRLIREDIEFVFVAHPDLKPIHADPAQIQQIVMNLAVNARDAMPTGGKLTIETANVDFDDNYIHKHPVAKPGKYAMMAISDTGIGMEEETKSHLFEPFYTTKERGKGTGLGLATVYGIVKQSNGFIWVYSEPGKGTTFKIYFPEKEGGAIKSETAFSSDSGFRGSETILVVEDEAAVRTLARRILKDSGYTVLEAREGTEALRLAKEYSDDIHMVITDVVMPGLGGAKLVAGLEAERPGIKALYISGYTDNAIVHHGILDSNVAFLQKPFTVEGLARKVREVLDS